MTFADIALHVPHFLLPSPAVDLTAWSVVACDQYTSEPEYWRRTAERIGSRPSTLKLILPEAYLGESDRNERIRAIVRTMRQYVREGVLVPYGPGFVRLERRTARGIVRRGLVVALDLEAYDFRPGAQTLIRASEETVAERLPPRAAIRRRAVLEVPHVMVLIDDPDRTVIEPLFELPLPLLYDFELTEGAGHVRGALVSDEPTIRGVVSALRALAAPSVQRRRYGVGPSRRVLYAVGDGNHSFATARVIWEEIQRKHTAALSSHPARYALVELVNIHDSGLIFEPIHRLVRAVDAETLLVRMKAWYERRGSRCEWHLCDSLPQDARVMERREGAQVRRIACVAGGRHGFIEISPPCHALAVADLQNFLDEYSHGGTGLDIDYIHGDDVLWKLAAREHTLGFLMPPLAKDDLFKTLVAEGALPRKTFSIGAADEKRFYVECRRIVP